MTIIGSNLNKIQVIYLSSFKIVKQSIRDTNITPEILSTNYLRLCLFPLSQGKGKQTLSFLCNYECEMVNQKMKRQTLRIMQKLKRERMKKQWKVIPEGRHRNLNFSCYRIVPIDVFKNLELQPTSNDQS